MQLGTKNLESEFRDSIRRVGVVEIECATNEWPVSMDDYMPLLKRRITPFLSSLPCLFLVPCLFFCESCCGTLEQGIALQELKNSGWITKSLPSWVAGTDPCVQVWAGVDCDTQGNIITLNLTHMGLNGPIPNAMGRLTTLVQLDMGNNKRSDVE